MNKEKICLLDIDEVCFDYLGGLLGLHNKLHGTTISKQDLTTWDIDNLLITNSRGKVTLGSEIRATMNKYENHGLLASLEPLPFAKEAIDIMGEFGYKVILLTARKQEFQTQTIISLLKHNIKHDALIFHTDKKWAITELFKTYEIELYVDDRSKYIYEVADFPINNVCILTQAHNQNDVFPPHIKRVGDLMGAVSLLKPVVK